MKKIFGILGLVAVALTGCGPSQPYQASGYDQPVVQPAPQPLGGHGDAVVAGVVGYMAGKAMARRQERRYYSRPVVRNYYTPAPVRTVYRSTPSYSSYRSTYRSSGYGSFRSRR